MVTITNGRKVVAAAGTPEALVAESTPVQSVVIQAEEDNTGDIMVGASGVDETPATATGHRLTAGKSLTISAGESGSGRGLLDLAKVFIDAATNGDGVTYLAMSGNQ